ncbi:hypothetical protein BO71DRAFT_456701 [Aspergillus ellipticus CBS 707.79]|uniref:Alpha/beta hydrolase fold-3 domain-containing protein n=1 Tax=Aspergillus ellipticus CBS 707.79 TaxID=1448320 RepID=A0A319DEH4_9EURO|nr:hypothetical protein BO71DRAFT_456701 [Aspergillus ellipticus CBS 707.79]
MIDFPHHLSPNHSPLPHPRHLPLLSSSHNPSPSRLDLAPIYRPQALQHLVALRDRYPLPPPKSLPPEREQDRFVVIYPSEPPNSKSCPYQSYPQHNNIVLRNPSIRLLPIGAVWYKQPPETPPTRLILHFHSGAYAVPIALKAAGDRGCSAKPSVPILQVQYRLSGPTSSKSNETCFPAALQDAITTYWYVLDTLKVHSSQVILSGDSAGGNLVLALLRYLSAPPQTTETEDPDKGSREEDPPITPLPIPRSVFLWSPWLDLTLTSTASIDRHCNAKTDFLHSALAEWGASCYTP